MVITLLGSIVLNLHVSTQSGVTRIFPGHQLFFEILQKNTTLCTHQAHVTKFEHWVNFNFSILNCSEPLFMRISQADTTDQQLINDFPVSVEKIVFDEIFSVKKTCYIGYLIKNSNIIDQQTNTFYSGNFLVYKFDLPFINFVYNFNFEEL